jgi:hypothetical protein
MVSISCAAEVKDRGKDIDISNPGVTGNSSRGLINVYHQIIDYRYPGEWGINPAFKEEKGDHFGVGLMPKGQKRETWKDMLIIQGFNNLAKVRGMSAVRFMDSFRQSRKELVPASEYFKELYRGDINGYSGVIALIGMKEVPINIEPMFPKGCGEIGLYLFIKGESDMYIMHRMWKSEKPYTDKKLPMSKADLNLWVDYLKQVRLISNK